MHPRTGEQETEREYEAFKMYLRIPVAHRSLCAVDALLRRNCGKPPRRAGGKTGGRRYSRWVEKTSSKWEWVGRAAALQDDKARGKFEEQFTALWPWWRPDAVTPAMRRDALHRSTQRAVEEMETICDRNAQELARLLDALSKTMPPLEKVLSAGKRSSGLKECAPLRRV